jgi:hypothetical protein
MANFFSYTADVRNLAQATVLTCVSAHGLVNYFSNQFVRNRFPKHLGVADWDLVMMYRLVREGMPVKQIFWGSIVRNFRCSKVNNVCANDLPDIECGELIDSDRVIQRGICEYYENLKQTQS